MDVKVRKVGNSLTVTIPQKIANIISIKENDVVSVQTDNDNIIMSESKKTRFENLLENYYGKPIEEIGIINEGDTEIDYGEPVGEETW